jgi:hypothetical protein
MGVLNRQYHAHGVLHLDYRNKFSTFRQVFSTVYQMRPAPVENLSLFGDFYHPAVVVENIVENLPPLAV